MRATWSLLLLLAPAPALCDEWRDAYEKDGVRVEVRSVPGSAVQEIRAQGLIEAPASALFAVLRDITAYPEFIPTTESTRFLREDGGSKLYHMVIHPPWLSRRDYCVRSTQMDLGQGKYMTRWSLANEVCPAPERSVVRIQRNEGFWLLVPSKDGKGTLVTYQGLTDPGGQVPAWIVNRASPREVPTFYQGLRRVVRSPRYALAR